MSEDIEQIDSDDRDGWIGSHDGPTEPLLYRGPVNCDIPETTIDQKPWLPQRYMMATMLCLAGVHSAAMRVNFNIVMVNLLNITQDMNDTADECPVTLNASSSSKTGGYLNYDESVLFGSFYYGYTFVAQILGGLLAERIGAKVVLTLVIFLSATFTMLTPLAVNSFVALVAVRVLLGFSQGPLFPCYFVFLGRWTPPAERTTLTAISISGNILGNVIAQALTGYLCSTTFLGGWPSAFYLIGLSSLVWLVIWCIYGADSPDRHRFISVYEKNYIERETEMLGQAVYEFPPLKKLLTSVPFWAFMVISCTDSFGYYVFYTGVPLYLKQILHFNIAEDGFLSALPYLVNWVAGILLSPLFDFLLGRNIISITAQRKLFSFIGEAGMGVFLIAVGYVACDHTIAVTLLVCALTVNCCTLAGYNQTPLDIAPMYSGTIVGIANGASNLFGFISPVIMYSITKGLPSLTKWRSVFYVAGGAYTAGAIIFALFGSGKELMWAKELRIKDTRAENNDTHTNDST